MKGLTITSRVPCEDSQKEAGKPLSAQKFVHFAKLATSSDAKRSVKRDGGAIQEQASRLFSMLLEAHKAPVLGDEEPHSPSFSKAHPSSERLFAAGLKPRLEDLAIGDWPAALVDMDGIKAVPFRLLLDERDPPLATERAQELIDRSRPRKCLCLRKLSAWKEQRTEVLVAPGREALEAFHRQGGDNDPCIALRQTIETPAHPLDEPLGRLPVSEIVADIGDQGEGRQFRPLSKVFPETTLNDARQSAKQHAAIHTIGAAVTGGDQKAAGPAA